MKSLDEAFEQSNKLSKAKAFREVIRFVERKAEEFTKTKVEANPEA